MYVRCRMECGFNHGNSSQDCIAVLMLAYGTAPSGNRLSERDPAAAFGPSEKHTTDVCLEQLRTRQLDRTIIVCIVGQRCPDPIELVVDSVPVVIRTDCCSCSHCLSIHVRDVEHVYCCRRRCRAYSVVQRLFSADDNGPP